MENQFNEVKDLIHGLDKNLTSQISGLDKNFAVLQQHLKTIHEKIEALEKKVSDKAEKNEVMALKKEVEGIKKEFEKIKLQTSKNSDTRADISKFVWLIFAGFISGIIGLIFYIIKIKAGV